VPAVKFFESLDPDPIGLFLGGQQVAPNLKRRDSMVMNAELNWTDGMQFVARAGESPAVVMDNPDGGSGASPMALMLIATAGCTAMDVISILKKKRRVVNGFKVNISGARAEEHPRRYTRIHIEYVVYGRDIKPDGVQQAIDLSERKYCSATASLNAEITHSFRIEAS
jgi:putative redox protein